METLKKCAGFIIFIITTAVAVFDFYKIIDIKNFSLKIFLYVIIVLLIPISFSSILSLYSILIQNKNIVVDGIDLITINHEFSISNDLLKKTRYLQIEKVHYIYEFNNNSFTSIRSYKGKCISLFKKITGFPFVVAGDSNARFEDINCYGYDLLADPYKNTKRFPSLIENEGLYKFAMFTFSSPLKYGNEFQIETHYTWPNCVSSIKDYILVSPIFSKKSFNEFDVELRFYHHTPLRVKKYYIDKYKRVISQGEVIKDLSQRDSSYTLYKDSGVKMRKSIGYYIYIYEFV